MTQITEATFEGGILRPDSPLNLREHERVRVIVVSLESAPCDREAALQQLRQGIDAMGFCSVDGHHPSLDQRQ